MADILGSSDVAAATRVLTAAFWDYPETTHLLPDERGRGHVLPRYLRSDARDALRFGLLLGARSGGSLAGAAAWIPPEAYPVSLARQAQQVIELLPSLRWSWRSAREAERGQRANRARHRIHPPHYYLRAVGVDPARQGRGLGSRLVRPVLEVADREGVGCFLQTATEANVSWYGRFGFTVVAAYRPTPTWPHTWAMWREPRG